MTPPDPSTDLPCPSVQALLSEYLDGCLASATHQHVQDHLAQCPSCLEVYVDLRSSQAALAHLQHSVVLPEGMNGLWSRIQGQLQADQGTAASCQYDLDFLSTYYDGELPKTDPHFSEFEAHLTACGNCNKALGDFQELSTQYQGFLHRLEEQSPPQLAQQVMAALRQPAACSFYPIEVLSAFYDEALSPKEAMAMSLHLEQCESCHGHLQSFHQISEHIQTAVALQKASAPSLLPAVQEALRATPIPIGRGRRLFNQPRIAIPAAAAAVFFFAMFSMGQPSDSTDPDTLFAGQIASLNAKATSAATFEEMQAPEIDSFQRPGASSPEPTPDRQVAIHGPETTPHLKDFSVDPDSAPTAEEYLFQQSHQELPNEELPLILGAPRP